MLQFPFILRNITNWIYGNQRHIELSQIELKVDESKILCLTYILCFGITKAKKALGNQSREGEKEESKKSTLITSKKYY